MKAIDAKKMFEEAREAYLKHLALLEDKCNQALSKIEQKKEPLIKDPKTRKAVRAWAEAIEAKSVLARKDFKYFEYEGYRIEFPSNNPSDYIEFYAITELCGEEEE